MLDEGGRTQVLVAAALVAAAVLAGVALRLDDPLSNPVIAAEDPYTHMALVREHLRDGTIESLNEGSETYPPGMHALLATIHVATGVGLPDLFRVGPPAMGGIGVLGVALLLWRHAGRAAAVVGAVAMAVLPEAIFRSGMMAPTALDLALLPFLFLALIETVQGRLAWAAPAAAVAALLLMAHPWVFAIVAPAGVAFLLLALLAPAPEGGSGRLSARGLAMALLVVGSASSLTLSGCGGACGPGFTYVLPGLAGVRELAPWVLGATVTASLALWVLAGPVQRGLDRLTRRKVGWPGRIATASALGLACAALVVPALLGGLPAKVDLVAMMGAPVLALAAVAVVALPFHPTPAAHLGAGITAATAPFVLYNVFDSPYWPHRTAAYLGLGLVLLAGTLAVAALRTLAAAWPAGTTRTPRADRMPRRVALASAVPLLVVAGLGATVYAQTPAYEGGWYRLYDACAMDALLEVAEVANQEPGLLVVAGTWQAKLVLAAHIDDARRVWFAPHLFTSQEARDGLRHRDILAVADPLLARELPRADTTFLGGWEPVGSWCHGAKGPQVTAAIHRPGGTP